MSKRTTDSTTLDDGVNKQVKTAPSENQLIGKAVSSVCLLLYHEDEDYSFYLQNDDLKEMVEHAGGTFGSINGKTDIVVTGEFDREWSKKVPDTWTNSAKCKALLKQQNMEDRKQGALSVVDFKAFVKQHALTAKVERLLCTAAFGGDKRTDPKLKKKYKAPGKARNKGSFKFATYVHTGSDLKGMFKGKYLHHYGNVCDHHGFGDY